MNGIEKGELPWWQKYTLTLNEAKRFHDVTLQRLEVVKARRGLFNDWLKSKGKLGGQHKVPRLSNSRKNIDELLDMNVASNA